MKLVLVVAWEPRLAPEVPWFEYLFSAHERVATPTGPVAIGWYHAGVWVIDVSTRERQAQPVILASYQPREDINVQPSTMALTPVPLVPFVWVATWDA